MLHFFDVTLELFNRLDSFIDLKPHFFLLVRNVESYSGNKRLFKLMHFNINKKYANQ